MKCPFCGEDDTRVTDTRSLEDGNSIRRKRVCESCGKRFITYEKAEMIPLMVIKKDDRRVPFDRNKLEAGIIRSCHKRPISMQQIKDVSDDIENRLFSLGEREIRSMVIGELVMEKLKKLDQVAYVRFASVYREFKDVNTFVEEIGKLLKSNERETSLV